MPGGSFKVFVSATTKDLGQCRRLVEKVLLDFDFHPKTQEHFPPDYRELSEFLRDAVAQCSAVICLVGEVYGAAPTNAGEPPRSYTQIEYDVARELGKPVFVFLTDKSFLPDQAYCETPEQREWQQRHRETLLQSHKCEFFDRAEQLELRLARAMPALRETVGHLPMRYLHPPRPAAYFAGRVEELNQLRAALRAKSPSVVSVIGMGGQGKTTLAHQAISTWQGFPFAAGFWCTAYRGGFTFDMFLDEALGYLLGDRFDKRLLPELSVRIERLHGLLQQRPTLIVIDGIERWLHGWNAGTDLEAAETVEERRGFHEGLDDFLAGAAGLNNGSHLILTSRALPAVLDDAGTAVVPVREPSERDLGLQGLDPQASIQLLESLGIKGEPAELRSMADNFGRHPLALTVLGGLLSKKYGGRIARLPNVAALDPRRSLHQLFEETRANLPGRTVADRFLQVAAHCLENPSLALISSVWDEPSRSRPAADDLLEQAVTLADWHLVDWDGENEVVGLHPLVKEFFAAQVPAEESKALHRRLCGYYAAQPILDGATTLEHAGARVLAIEHAVRAADSARCLELMFAHLTPLYSFVEWLASFGHLSIGRTMLETVASMATGAARAECLIARAALERQSGDLAQARAGLTEAITLLDESPQNRASLVCALSNRGNVQRQLYDYERSKADFDRSAELLRQLEPLDSARQLQLATVLVNRATVLREMGELRRAIADCDTAIELHRRNLPPILLAIDVQLAAARLNRGNLLADLHEDEAAQHECREAAAIYGRLVQIGQREFRSLLAHVRVLSGAVLHHQDRDAEALAEFDDAVAVLREFVESGRQELEVSLALARMNRALAALKSHRLEEARADNDFAVSTFTRHSENGRKDVGGSLANALLSGVLVRLAEGDLSGAEVLRQRGLEIARRLMAQGTKDLLIIMVRYAALFAVARLEAAPRECVALLDEAFERAEESLRGPGTSEGLVVELRQSLSRLEPVESMLSRSGFDLQRLRRLRELVD